MQSEDPEEANTVVAEPETNNLDSYPDHSRSGCSCWTIMAVIAFAVVALVLFGFQIINHFIREASYKSSSVTSAQYQAWANEPVILTAEMRATHDPLPPDLIKERQMFHGALEKIYREFTDPMFETEEDTLTTSSTIPGIVPIKINDSIFNRLIFELPLDTTATTCLTSFTTEMKPLIARGRALVDRADYVLNDRTVPGADVAGYYEISFYPVLPAYAMAKAHYGDFAATTETLSVAIDFLRHDPEFTISAYYLKIISSAVNMAARQTSDTQILQSMLTLLQDSREILLHSHNSMSFIGGQYVGLARQMQELGYRKNAPETRLDYLTLKFNYPDYCKWLSKHLSPNDPRIQRAKDLEYELGPGYDIYWANDLGPLRMFMRPLMESSYMSTCLNACESDLAAITEASRNRAVFDLQIIALARRIALIDGKPDMTDPADFVPGVFKTFPDDPFGTGTLRFSEKRDSFYSVGEDAIDGSTDDLYEIEPLIEEVPIGYFF